MLLFGIILACLLLVTLVVYLNGDSIASYIVGEDRNEFHADKKKNEYW